MLLRSNQPKRLVNKPDPPENVSANSIDLVDGGSDLNRVDHPIEDADWFGLFSRLLLYFILMSVAFGVAYISGFEQLGLATKALVAVWLIVLVPVGVSIVSAELPRGADWVMMRLGVATFCRTGLPLLIVIFVDTVKEGLLGDAGFGYLAFFYLVGFVTSVWVSVGRFRLSGSLNGVDSAVV